MPLYTCFNTATPHVLGKICREDGQVDPQCFVSCQQFAEEVMDRDYFPGFLSSDFHCKHQIDLLTSTKVHLADIIYNDVAMFYFSEVGGLLIIAAWGRGPLPFFPWGKGPSYFPSIPRGDFHCNHQIDLLTSTKVHLADIIYNDVAMFYFSEVRGPHIFVPWGKGPFWFVSMREVGLLFPRVPE